MCGIAGILRLDGSAPDPDQLRRMTGAMAHRGPDGSGHWLDGPVALGHRRLSIIDLSTAASQPMLSADGSVVIVFNGEIYNYRELARDLAAAGLPCRTTSDTEVILNLYRLLGPACLPRLRGMFAFAIWDRVRRELFIARDRVGIKPLYLLRGPGVLAFASEVKAIAAAGLSRLRVDSTALAGFFRFLVVPQPASIFDDIRKLEPGHSLLVAADGSTHESAWWSPPPPVAGDARDEPSAIDALQATLEDSVRFHMVADVPVGAFLSGGLDSSTVVSLMRAESPGQPLHAFSIAFPGRAGYDEEPWARRVAELKQVDFHVGTIDEGFLADLDDMVWHLDEPFAVSSAWATYYLARHAASRMKVVLTGDGGDELFAGYQGYQNDAYVHQAAPGALLAGAKALLLACARAGLLPAAGRRLLTGLARRSGSEGLRYSEQVAQNSLHALGMALAPGVFADALAAWQGNLMARYYDEAPATDRLGRKLYAEYKTRLVDEMLMKVDRMTMAHSLEARVPLLDHHVVESAFRLPSGLKLGRGREGRPESKYALKAVASRYLPDDIVYRRKQGFDIPVGDWVQGPFLAALGDRLLGGELARAGLLRESGVREILGRASDPRHNYASMLMVLLALEAWAATYARRIGRPTFA